MAKKIYHIPLSKTRVLIKENKSKFNRLTNSKKELEFFQLLGKNYYGLEIEEFLNFFKIDKNIDFAIKVYEHLNSINFIEEIAINLNFSQFNLKDNKTDLKNFFYGFCYYFAKIDYKLFKSFFQKIFMHYGLSLKDSSKIKIIYKDIATAIAKNYNVTIKESFGENEDKSFFKLYIDKKLIFNQKGKSIKVLRKRAYKEAIFYFSEEK